MSFDRPFLFRMISIAWKNAFIVKRKNLPENRNLFCYIPPAT
jgi:hypothetical protein